MKLAPLLMFGALAIGSLTACGPDREEAFLNEYRERVPDSEVISDEQLLGTAKDTCRQLEDGMTLEEIRDKTLRNYGSGKQPDADAVSRIIIGGQAAAQEYCPEAGDSK